MSTTRKNMGFVLFFLLCKRVLTLSRSSFNSENITVHYTVKTLLKTMPLWSLMEEGVSHSPCQSMVTPGTEAALRKGGRWQNPTSSQSRINHCYLGVPRYPETVECSLNEHSFVRAV